jgi:hypothetical protein
MESLRWIQFSELDFKYPRKFSGRLPTIVPGGRDPILPNFLDARDCAFVYD